MNMTDILLTVSVGCNLWFLFLLFDYLSMQNVIEWRLFQNNLPEKHRTSSAGAISRWHQPGQPLPY